MGWDAGEQILWCYRREVRPVTVVADDAEAGLVVWLAAGTPLLVALPTDGRGIRDRPIVERFTGPWVYAVRHWTGAGVLKIARPGQPYSVWRFQHEDGSHWAWYANLEAPLQRGRRGVLTQDHVLDVVLPAGGAPTLKDEDELEGAVEAGRFTPEEADAIRADGERATAAMRAGEYPFDDTWLHWTPDPAWPIPALPADAAALAGQPAALLADVLSVP